MSSVIVSFVSTLAVLSPLSSISDVSRSMTYLEQSGTDICAQINAAAGALPPTGGIIDARSLQGPQPCSADIVLRKPIALLICGVTLTLDTHRIVIVAPGASIRGCGDATVQAEDQPFSKITYGGQYSAVQVGDGLHPIPGVDLDGFHLQAVGSAVSSPDAVGVDLVNCRSCGVARSSRVSVTNFSGGVAIQFRADGDSYSSSNYVGAAYLWKNKIGMQSLGRDGWTKDSHLTLVGTIINCGGDAGLVPPAGSIGFKTSPFADSMIGFSTDAEGCETGYWLAGQNATFFAPRSENCGTHIAIPRSASHTNIIGAISEGLGTFRDDRSTSTFYVTTNAEAGPSLSPYAHEFWGDVRFHGPFTGILRAGANAEFHLVNETSGTGRTWSLASTPSGSFQLRTSNVAVLDLSPGALRFASSVHFASDNASIDAEGKGTFGGGVVAPTYQTTLRTPPSSQISCSPGQTWADQDYLYVCVAGDRIRRAALSDF